MNVESKNIDDILNGPEYFLCKRFRVRMKRSICIERQKGLSKQANDGWVSTVDAIRYEKCAGCAQGAEIMAGAGRSHHEEHEGHEEKPLITDPGETVMSKVIICKKCGEKPAMTRGDGRTVNGYCRECMEKVAQEKRLKIKEIPLCPRCGQRPQTIRKNGTAAGMCSVCRGALMKGEGGRQGEMMNVERRTLNVESKRFDGALLVRFLEEKGLMDPLINDAAEQYRGLEHHAAHLIRVGLKGSDERSDKLLLVTQNKMGRR